MTMTTIKSFLTVISIAIMGLMAGSCDKTPINGDLDGMWQLMRVEDNGTTIDVAATIFSVGKARSRDRKRLRI